jgi:autotransporter-associated beta strand protein
MKKRRILSAMAGMLSVTATALPADFPIIVGNSVVANYSDLEYVGHENISTAESAPDNSVAAVYIGNGSTISISNSFFSDNYLEVANSVAQTALIRSGVSDLTIKDSIFYGNTSYSVHSAVTSSTGVSGSVIKMFVGNRSGYTNYGNLLVENVLFDSNQSLAERQAFGNVYLTNPNLATFRNTIFRNNLNGGVKSGSINALGSAITGYGIGDTVIEDSLFTGNIAISSYFSRGGAIFANTEYATWKDNQVSLTIRNTQFVGNSAVQVETERTDWANDGENAWVAGGALYIARSGTAVFGVEIANTTFTGNFVFVEGYQGGPGAVNSGGGAIYSQDANIKISASKNITSVGNYVEILGEKLDSRGGFLYMNSGTVEFEITGNAVMTIGDGRVGYDSIASRDDSIIMSKTGTGRLTVNSSMEHFTGAINVNEGVLEANGIVGASAINISNGATLALTIKGNYMLSNKDLVLNNSGRINLVAVNGARGDYILATNTGIADFGDVKAFGGSFAGNIFSVNYAGDVKVGESGGEPIIITNNAVVSVSNEDTSPVLEMAFNVSSGSVSVGSITDTTETLSGLVPDYYKYVSAYSFDVTMGDGDEVVLSFMIGDRGLGVDDFTIFYRSEGGEWVEAVDISDIVYDGEFFSFVVTHFSEYGFAAIPEPGTYVAMFGLIALALVAYKRRK